MKRFNINLPDTLYEELRVEAFNKNTSISSIVVDRLSGGKKEDTKHYITRKEKNEDIGEIEREPFKE